MVDLLSFYGTCTMPYGRLSYSAVGGGDNAPRLGGYGVLAYRIGIPPLCSGSRGAVRGGAVTCRRAHVTRRRYSSRRIYIYYINIRSQGRWKRLREFRYGL